jgi:hypothetical protein
MRVIRVALASLYGQQYGHLSVRSTRHTQVIASLRKRLDDLENCPWEQVIQALVRDGLHTEAVILTDTERIREADFRLETGQLITSQCDTYPTVLMDRMRHKAPPVLWLSDSMLAKKPVWFCKTDEEKAVLEDGTVVEPPKVERVIIGGVGCRNPLTVGIAIARSAGSWVARNDYLGVSGGAIGCDAAFAHSVSASFGDMLHVLPTGIDVPIGPYEGYAISAYPPGTPFTAANAMERNQVIYSLANISLVCSVRFRTGGSWHGAMNALRARQPIAVADWNSVLKLRQTKSTNEGTYCVAQRALCSQGAYQFVVDTANIRGDMEPELEAMLAWANDIRAGTLRQGLFAS